MLCKEHLLEPQLWMNLIKKLSEGKPIGKGICRVP